MKKIFENILSNYLYEKNKSFKNNNLANYIRKDAKEVIEKNMMLNLNKYKIKGSPGQGGWAIVPWIGLFDLDITDTAENGYYIVYLFQADMKGVYLSLNQGWTYFKDKYKKKLGRNKIKATSSYWRNNLSSILEDFSKDDIDLNYKGNSTDLPEGYELGHICGKYYELGKIPEDKELINDLDNLLGIYRELKGKIKNTSIEDINNAILANEKIDLSKKNNQNFGKESKSTVNKINKIIDNPKSFELELIDFEPYDKKFKENNE